MNKNRYESKKEKGNRDGSPFLYDLCHNFYPKATRLNSVTFKPPSTLFR
jgi:hypothetical protein